MRYQFFPNFQKQFDRQKKFVGAEILMRSPRGNILEIVRSLEQKGKVEILDLLAFQAAINWSKKYNLPCSANFSAISLAKNKVFDYLAKYKNDNVLLELTETIQLSEEAANNIKLLVACGYELSIDDFGSEHNGLNLLATLPFSELKLDQYLIKNLDTTKVIVKHTIDMAHDYGCKVVAEGIENVKQFNTLCEMQCDRFQGYLLHRPEAFIL